jgi:2-polyprenyl-6-methoxyphenol hydroxylase-like FAD-dependent oxidoreductase
MDPVVVAGAGPVGLTTALLLAGHGVPSVVLEAKEAPDRVGSKAICMQRDALWVLDRVGVAEAMVAEGVTWTVGRTYYRDRELFSVRFPEEQGGMPPWINLSQSRTEALLIAEARRSALVDLRWGERVTGVVQDGHGVEVATEGRGGRGTVGGSFLVGADGSRSAVRRLLGVDFPGRSYEEQFVIVDVACDLDFPNERRFYFDPPWNPGRQVLVHECPGKVWRIDWQVPAGYDLEAERASGALEGRIRRIVGERDYEVVWASAYRFHERVASSFRVGRAFLAGDAAHLYAPFGARGLNSGICDAANLAWKLAWELKGWAGPALLDTYASEREAAAAENLAVTTATMDFLVPQSGAQWAWRRQVLEGAVSDPAARAQVDSGRLAEPYVYSSSPLTTPGGPVGALVPGAVVPDAMRRLVGLGLTVLAGGGIEAGDMGMPVALRVVPGAVPPGWAAAVRPDWHVAGVVPGEREALSKALRRAAGATVAGDESRGGGRAVLPMRW